MGQKNAPIDLTKAVQFKSEIKQTFVKDKKEIIVIDSSEDPSNSSNDNEETAESPDK